VTGPTVAAQAKLAADAVTKRLGVRRPEVAIVLGSGLGHLTERIENSVRIPYAEIPGFPEPGVAGHKGELVAGMLGGVPVLAQGGRFHLYEGHDAVTAGLPVRVFALLGVRTLIVTNAAGGIRANLYPGALMLISDHINLMWANPLIGPMVEGEERFPDMTEPYDAGLRDVARQAAQQVGVQLAEGVYAGLRGPSYETPAEIRMLERVGADAVGMSTVPEVIVARARGMRCLGFSTITNMAAGLSGAPLSHAEVLQMGQQMGDELGRVIAEVLHRLQ
jgi:purine-nucleoside phosphorylase